MKGTIFRKKYSNEAYLKKVINTKEDNLMFMLNFLTLFTNTFIKSMLIRTNQVKVVEKLVLVGDFEKIVWCKYVLDCLVTRKAFWKRDD